MTNYERLQKISGLVAKQIRLEELYRQGKLDIEGAKLHFPPDLVNQLKHRFAQHRSEIIILENSIIEDEQVT